MKNFLSLIKFSHTIFAMPFALTGFFIAYTEQNGNVPLRIFLGVILCMVFARSAAMAFNRYIDREIDAKNPRTQKREIPAGIISPRSALLFVIINSALFIATCWFLNPLCFYLSPVALAIVLGYSFTKRFTWLCHFILGLGLALAPVGAYLAVREQFGMSTIWYGLSVLFWTAGFDIIYSLQDEELDKSLKLYSVPAWLGKKRALRLSEWVHLLAAAFMIFGTAEVQSSLPEQTGWLIYIGTAIFLGLLVYQHLIVKPNDLSRVNLAFFTTNGIASVLFGVFAIIDLLI